MDVPARIALRALTAVTTLSVLLTVALTSRRTPVVRSAAALAAALVLVVLVADRDFHLRFLARAAFPTGILDGAPGEGGEEVPVRFPPDVAPGTRVVYWAAEPGDHASPGAAYAGARNGGVATVAPAGEPTLLRVRPPGTYPVPWRGRLPAHVHFRAIERPGMLGPVGTVVLSA